MFSHIFKYLSASKDLIQNLLIVNQKRRYTTIDVLCHPWIITLGNSRPAPNDMAAHRHNLRRDYETQAKASLEEHRKLYGS